MSSNQDPSPTPNLGAANFASTVLGSKRPVLVLFWAPWSQPCQVLEAVLEKVARACGDAVKVVKVNADDHPELSLWYEIQSIPTLLYFVDGEPRTRVVGTASKEAILARLPPLPPESQSD